MFLGLIATAVALTGCQSAAQGNDKGAGAGGEGGGGAGPYVVTGVVTTTTGTPLAGAEVFAANTFLYDTNITVYTDANGSYRIDLPANPLGPWKIGAYVNVDYHGESYRLRLHPLLDEAVVPSEGGVRNLQWRLSGEAPGGDQFYGEEVWVHEYAFRSSPSIEDVELTFEPLEPLIDGSTIEAFTRRPQGNKIADVPLGYYRVSARYLPTDAPHVDLLVTRRFEDALAASVDAAFIQKDMSGTIMELEVGLPE